VPRCSSRSLPSGTQLTHWKGHRLHQQQLPVLPLLRRTITGSDAIRSFLSSTATGSDLLCSLPSSVVDLGSLAVGPWDLAVAWCGSSSRGGAIDTMRGLGHTSAMLCEYPCASMILNDTTISVGELFVCTQFAPSITTFRVHAWMSDADLEYIFVQALELLDGMLLTEYHGYIRILICNYFLY
jgi:hypothetical protein